MVPGAVGAGQQWSQEVPFRFTRYHMIPGAVGAQLAWSREVPTDPRRIHEVPGGPRHCGSSVSEVRLGSKQFQVLASGSA